MESKINDYAKFVDKTTSMESKHYPSFIASTAVLENNEPIMNVPRVLTSAIGMMAESGEFTELLKKMVFQGKEFNEDVYAAFKRGSDEVYAEVVEHSALAKKIHESAMNARKVVGDYVQLNDVAYISKRNASL